MHKFKITSVKNQANKNREEKFPVCISCLVLFLSLCVLLHFHRRMRKPTKDCLHFAEKQQKYNYCNAVFLYLKLSKNNVFQIEQMKLRTLLFHSFGIISTEQFTSCIILEFDPYVNLVSS